MFCNNARKTQPASHYNQYSFKDNNYNKTVQHFLLHCQDFYLCNAFRRPGTITNATAPPIRAVISWG